MWMLSRLTIYVALKLLLLWSRETLQKGQHILSHYEVHAVVKGLVTTTGIGYDSSITNAEMFQYSKSKVVYDGNS